MERPYKSGWNISAPGDYQQMTERQGRQGQDDKFGHTWMMEHGWRAWGRT